MFSKFFDSISRHGSPAQTPSPSRAGTPACSRPASRRSSVCSPPLPSSEEGSPMFESHNNFPGMNPAVASTNNFTGATPAGKVDVNNFAGMNPKSGVKNNFTGATPAGKVDVNNFSGMNPKKWRNNFPGDN